MATDGERARAGAAAARFADLRGASVFVTGGGRGIGAALTEGFAQQGARVAFVGRGDAGAFAAEVAGRTGAEVLFQPCDVTDTGALEAAMDRAAAAHGPIGVLVANAADDTRRPASEVTEAFWDASLAVNLRHYFFAARKAADGMRGRGGGAIVAYTSTSYMMPDSGYAPYIAANAGITGLVRTLAREWGPDGIRVNAVAPGWVMTERQRALWATPEAVARHLDRQALKAEIDPWDMVGPTLFLASSASRVVTGQVLAADAGVVVTG